MSFRNQVYDAAASFLLLTPLVLLFRHGTSTTLEQFVVSNYEERWIGATILVVIGIIIEVIVTFWQVSCACVSRTCTTFLKLCIECEFIGLLYNYQHRHA
jgi:hypothetical protein